MKQYFIKYNDFLNESLSSARKKYRDSGIMGIEFFDSLVHADPTPTKKYLEKMCEWYMETRDVPIIKFYVEKFHRLLPKLEQKDINQYDSFEDFKKLLMFTDSNTARKKAVTKDIEVVYETDKVQVTHPKTYEESCILGAGTQWCTASRDIKQHWDNYTKNELLTFYYIWFKDLDGIDSKFYKVAIGVDVFGSWQEIRDAEDRWVTYGDITEILKKYDIPLDIFERRINMQMRWNSIVGTTGLRDMSTFDILQYLSKYRDVLDLEKCLSDIKEYKDDIDLVSNVISEHPELQTQENFDYVCDRCEDSSQIFRILLATENGDLLTNDNWNKYKEILYNIENVTSPQNTAYQIRRLITTNEDFQITSIFRDFVEYLENFGFSDQTKKLLIEELTFTVPNFKEWYEQNYKQQ